MDEVGLEPTNPKGADLQSVVIAARRLMLQYNRNLMLQYIHIHYQLKLRLCLEAFVGLILCQSRVLILL